MKMTDAVVVTYEEMCGLDDDYGKDTEAHLFTSRELAIDHLSKIGFKPDPHKVNRMVFHQYHSEVHATILKVQWVGPL